MHDIVVVSALRTATGLFNGSLSGFKAPQLGGVIIERTLQDTKIPPEEITEVILGQVLTAGCGQNPARQAAISGGLPNSVPAFTLNQVCGSGMKSITLGCQNILSKILVENNDRAIVIAGGQESMTNSLHGASLHKATKIQDLTMEDLALHDGLTDAFLNIHMGVTAENIAQRYNLSRKEQDLFSVNSQRKAVIARDGSYFQQEIVSVNVKHPKEADLIFKQDECIREGMTEEALSRLKASFLSTGTVTPGNSSGINDGASIVLLMTRKEAERRGLEPMATIRSYADVGVDPAFMGLGPVPASKAALTKAKWEIKDLELIEANEAFAAQAMGVNKEMGWNTDIVNVNGGGIALGHPIGASGARIVVTILHEMKRRNAKKGLATLCIGGGMGIAMCLERG